MPTDTESRFRAGVALHREGDWQRAADAYAAVLASEPAHAGALSMSGALALQAGQPETAIEILTRAAEITPADPAIHFHLGLATQQLGSNELARQCYETAIALRADYREAIENLAVVLGDLGDTQGALAASERVLAMTPDSELALANAGTFALNLGRDADALRYFDRSLALYPFNANVHLKRSQVLLRDERFGEAETFVEAVVAPEVEPAALAVLARAKGGANLRVLAMGGMPDTAPRTSVRPISGGFLLQDADVPAALPELTVATDRAPTDEELEALRFAWRVCKHVRSNAIVLACGDGTTSATVGVGAGQMSRVDSVEISVKKAGDRAKGAVLASDAFFPFADGLKAAANAGVTAVIQPGGSKRDDEVIAAANEAGVAMVFTGRRHFRH